MPTSSPIPLASRRARLSLFPEANNQSMSAATKSRLGRGLGGLIAAAKPAPAPSAAPAPESHAAAPAAPVAGAPGYQEVAVHLIEPSPYQARREIPTDQLS